MKDGNGLGFEIVQIMYNARSVHELDEAMSVVNDAYRVLRGQMENLERLEYYGPR